MCDNFTKDNLIKIKYLCFLRIDTTNFRIIISRSFYTDRFETSIHCHREIDDFVEVAQNCKCRTEMKRKRKKITRRKRR